MKNNKNVPTDGAVTIVVHNYQTLPHTRKTIKNVFKQGKDLVLDSQLIVLES